MNSILEAIATIDELKIDQNRLECLIEETMIKKTDRDGNVLYSLPCSGYESTNPRDVIDAYMATGY